jgi:hypothetical protein
MANTNSRVQKHRDALRARGFRPVQLWVPDTRRAGFLDECARQTALIAASDAADETLQQVMEEAAADTEGWE